MLAKQFVITSEKYLGYRDVEHFIEMLIDGLFTLYLGCRYYQFVAGKLATTSDYLV